MRLWYIYRNELDEACFRHDMVYENFKDLRRRTMFNKVGKMYINELMQRLTLTLIGFVFFNDNDNDINIYNDNG